MRVLLWLTRYAWMGALTPALLPLSSLASTHAQLGSRRAEDGMAAPAGDITTQLVGVSSLQSGGILSLPARDSQTSGNASVRTTDNAQRPIEACVIELPKDLDSERDDDWSREDTERDDDKSREDSERDNDRSLQIPSRGINRRGTRAQPSLRYRVYFTLLAVVAGIGLVLTSFALFLRCDSVFASETCPVIFLYTAYVLFLEIVALSPLTGGTRQRLHAMMMGFTLALVMLLLPVVAHNVTDPFVYVVSIPPVVTMLLCFLHSF